MSEIMKQKTAVIAFVFQLFWIVQSTECESGQVKVYKGSTIYIGCKVDNWKGEQFIAFRGIPYAKAPINELRFKDPIPTEYHLGTVDARKDGKDCPSISTENASEDCLYVNVYSQNVVNKTVLRPVIAFIHPGGFYLGSGASTFLGPEYLLERNIVLVTFNYRLGSIGFLNLGTPDIPGNAGLKDQVMALRWTRDNIQYFGGDPNNVSLMGYSAGGMSVSLHLVSPMSQGLFHKAIIMSGSIPPQTKIPHYNQIELAKKQALVMGCKGPLERPFDIVQCLNKFSGPDIANTLRQMFIFGKDNPMFPWMPVIEPSYGQEQFLVEDPYFSLKANRFAKVPILIGFTNGELCTSAREIYANHALLSKFNMNFKSLAPICFLYSKHSRENEITGAIQSHYLRNVSVNENSFEQLCDLFSDSIIRFGSHKLASLTSSHVNVYPYRFSYKSKVSNINYPGHHAAEHLDDLMYLFKMPMVTFSPSHPDAAVVELMIDFFEHFVINGRPKKDFEYKNNKFAEIHTSVEIKDGSNFEQYSFWNDLL